MVEKMNLLVVMGGLAALGASVAWYLSKQGLFKKLAASTIKLGSYVIVYTDYVGPYKNVASDFKRVYALLKDNGFKVGKSCGFYYDDPAKVPGPQCRAKIGVIVHDGLAEDALTSAKEELLNHDVVKKENLKVGIFEETECMSIEFPLHGHLSILIGIMRCYPELMKHVNFCKHPASFELYDWPDKKLFITVPLKSVDDFLPFEIKKES